MQASSLGLVAIFELDLNAPVANPGDHPPSPQVVSETTTDDVDFPKPRVWRRQSSQGSQIQTGTFLGDRPGFIGSLPADEHLAKLALGPSIMNIDTAVRDGVAGSPGLGKDWKEAARKVVQIEEEKYAELQRQETAEDDAGSPADFGMTLIQPFYLSYPPN